MPNTFVFAPPETLDCQYVNSLSFLFPVFNGGIQPHLPKQRQDRKKQEQRKQSTCTQSALSVSHVLSKRKLNHKISLT